MSELVHLPTERAVLGAVLAGATVSDTGPLPVEAFGHPPHALVWQAMRDLDIVGKPVDHLTLSERLLAMPNPHGDGSALAAVGGPAALMALDQLVPVPGNLAAYCATLRDYATRRAIDANADAAKAGARDMARRPDAVASESCARFASVDTGTLDESGDSDLFTILDEWDRVAKGEQPEPYLPVPFAFMREAGLRGFPQNLSVWAGRSGIGKTAGLSTCMAHWLWSLPDMGGVFGLEDGARWFPERWIAYRLGIDYADVGVLRLNDWQQEKLVDFYETVGPLLRTKLKAYRRAGITSSELLARCRRWIAEGCKWIVIDHGLRVDYEVSGRDRLDVAIGRTVDALANLAANTRTHIIVAWHLNRANDDDSMPQRKDLKESGYLDAAARLILGAWRQDASPVDGLPRTLLTVVKANKVAPEGLTAQLEWAGRSGMFKPEGGRIVDFAAERAAVSAARKASRKRNDLFAEGSAS